MATSAFTFGSVGDIVALCTIVRRGAEALSSVRGSKAQYRSLQQEVWNLSQALVSVQSLTQEHDDLRRKGDLEKILIDCHECFVRFLKRIEVYECLDQLRDQRVSVKDIQTIFRKLKWPTQQRYCDAFRAEIQSHISSLTIILNSTEIDLLHGAQQSLLRWLNSYEQSLDKGRNENQSRPKDGSDGGLGPTRSAVPDQSAILGSKLDEYSMELSQSLHDAQVIHLENNSILAEKMLEITHALNKQNTEHQTKADHMLKLTANILHNMESTHQRRRFTTPVSPGALRVSPRNQVDQTAILLIQDISEVGLNLLVTLLRVARSLLRLGDLGILLFAQVIEHMLILCHIPASIKRKSVLFFEDALLNRFEIDVQFLCYATFVEEIERRFKGTDGQRSVELGNYLFEGRDKLQLNLQKRWDSASLANREIFMRITFESDSIRENTCPGCSRPCDTIGPDTEVVCQNCHMHFMSRSAQLLFDSANNLVQPEDQTGQGELQYVIQFFKRVLVTRLTIDKPPTKSLKIQTQEEHKVKSSSKGSSSSKTGVKSSSKSSSSSSKTRVKELEKPTTGTAQKKGKSLNWYCSECGSGPMDYYRDSYCANCHKRREGTRVQYY